MPYNLSFTDMRVENIQQFKLFNSDGSLAGIGLALNATLFDGDGEQRGITKVFDLSPAQEQQVRNFIKPFVQLAATEWDVNPPSWATT